jgi:hypothetical protein
MLPAVTTFAQNNDGNTVQEIPGIAIVKPQAWSKESDATVLEFTTYVDRRAAANAAAGYYEFQTTSGQKRQVDSSKVIKVILYPDPARIPTLVEKQDRERVEATLDEIAEVIKRFPATKTYLTPKLQSFVEFFSKFDGGEVKVDGVWIPRSSHLEKQAASLVDILKVEIERASPPGSFDLANDAKFLALRKMGSEAPKAKAFAEQMMALDSKLARGEARRQLRAKISDPALPYAEAVTLIAQFEAQQPAEDPESAAFLESWKSGLKQVAEMKTASGELATDFDPQLAPWKDTIGDIKPETVEAAATLNSKIAAFRSSPLLPKIKAQNQSTESVDIVVSGFLAMKPLIAGKQFLEVKELLDGMAPHASAVGPQSERLIGELQKSTTVRVELFIKARDEAKSLAEASKKEEAIAKYQEAFEVIPDPTVGRIIEELKAPAPAP